MIDSVLDIKRWGNSLGVRLPAAVARAASLSEHQRVRVYVEGANVVIAPAGDDTLTLDERLARFDSVRHGGEVMAVEPVGAERW